MARALQHPPSEETTMLKPTEPPATAILDAKILIVDDQEVNVQLLAQLLDEAGYTR